MAPSAAAAVYRPSALSISPPAHDDALQRRRRWRSSSPTPPRLLPRLDVAAAILPQEHCLTLGGAADLSLDKPADQHHHDTTSATTTEKPLRRFLDEWPRSDDGRTPWDGTQLSISIPTAAASSPDLAIAGAASRYHNNGTCVALHPWLHCTTDVSLTTEALIDRFSFFLFHDRSTDQATICGRTSDDPASLVAAFLRRDGTSRRVAVSSIKCIGLIIFVVACIMSLI
uniref:Uncharacterized protein n=1 Tax=Oryza barthii TaxID=65489 RepID=A0A0D3G3M6_9ORYZ